MNTAPIYLHAIGAEAKPAVIIGQGLPTTRNGLNCHYFWRQSIADGEYSDDDRGIKVPVNASRRQTWERNYRRMREAGEEPPVVMDHQDTKSAATLGYVVDVRQNGKWLEELHQYLGDDSRDIALRNKISVGIHPKYKTGNGVFLGDTIIHSATTPRPVVPGQGDAVPLTASRGPVGDAIYLSLAAPSEQESQMDLTALRKALGAADTVPDADVITQASAKLGTIPTLEQAKTTAETALSAAQVQLSRAPKPAEDFPAAIATGSVNLLSREIELMAREGHISGEQATAAKALLGSAEKPNTLMLSRTGADHPAEAWLKVLALGKSGVAANGESKTGVQELSRQKHDNSQATNLSRTGDEDPVKTTADARAEATKWQAEQLQQRGLAVA